MAAAALTNPLKFVDGFSSSVGKCAVCGSGKKVGLMLANIGYRAGMPACDKTYCEESVRYSLNFHTRGIPMSHFQGWDGKKNDGWSRQSQSTGDVKSNYQVMAWRWSDAKQKIMLYVNRENTGCHVDWDMFVAHNQSKIKAMGKLNVSATNPPPANAPSSSYTEKFVKLWNTVVDS